MVLPFLIRRIGRQHAHYLTCTTQPIGAQRAEQWGLVDEATPICEHEARAVRANREMFLKSDNLRRISDFTTLGLMPWEREFAGVRAGLGRTVS